MFCNSALEKDCMTPKELQLTVNGVASRREIVEIHSPPQIVVSASEYALSKRVLPLESTM